MSRAKPERKSNETAAATISWPQFEDAEYGQPSDTKRCDDPRETPNIWAQVRFRVRIAIEGSFLI